MITVMVCVIAYILIGIAWWRTWMWMAIRNDIKEFGSLNGLRPIDPKRYLRHMLEGVFLWPITMTFYINGAAERRMNKW